MKAIVSIYDDDNRLIRENWLLDPMGEELKKDKFTGEISRTRYFRFQVKELLNIGGIIRGEAKNENN